MARPLRLQLEDALYHITSRGNGRADIFLDAKDRNVFIKKMGEAVDRYSWIIYAYCLMGNHYHLLLRIEHPNLSAGMRHLNGVYAQYFNRRHERVGHVFQGRFKSILIRDEEMLLTVARYVVLNPVRAGMVDRPGDWKWSSYRATVGLERPAKFFNPDYMLCLFSDHKEQAMRLYDAFVHDGIGASSPLSGARGGIILGDVEHASPLRTKIDRMVDTEIPKRERHAARPDLEEIFSNGEWKMGVYFAIYRYGYKLKDVGDFLGLHYSTVSRIGSRMASVVERSNSTGD